MHWIDFSICAEIALALFAIAFVVMLLATLRIPRRATDAFASIPLTDSVQDPRDGTPLGQKSRERKESDE